LSNLRDIDPGFRSDHLMSFSINPALNGYDTPRSISLFDQLIANVKAQPGVSATGISDTPLLTETISSARSKYLGASRGKPMRRTTSIS
jgi:hypothetical protein